MESENNETLILPPFGIIQKQDLVRALSVWSETEVFYLASPWFRKKYGENVFFASPWLKSKLLSKGWSLFQIDLYGIRDACTDFYELKGLYRTWSEKFSEGVRSPEIPMQCAYYEYLLVKNYLDPDLEVLAGKFLHFSKKIESYTFNYMVSLRTYDKARQTDSLELLKNLGYGLFVVRGYDNCYEIFSPKIYELNEALSRQRLNILEAKLRHFGKIH